MDKIKFLSELFEALEELPHRDSTKLDGLERRIKLFIRTAFGEKSHYLKELDEISFYPILYPASSSTENRSWDRGKGRMHNFLCTMKEEIELKEGFENTNKESNTIKDRLNKLIEIGEKFVSDWNDEINDDNQYFKWISDCQTFLSLVLFNLKIDTDKTLFSRFFDIDYTSGFPRPSSLIPPLKSLRETIEGNLIERPLISPNVLQKEFQNFMEIKNVRDDFYLDLIREINMLFSYKLSTSLWVMVRKLFENLLIDILRKKYGSNNLDLYYREKQGRHHDFNILLENFKARIKDFKPITPDLDVNLINKLNGFRARGGSAAHSLINKASLEKIMKSQEDIEYLAKLLFRILEQITK